MMEGNYVMECNRRYDRAVAALGELIRLKRINEQLEGPLSPTVRDALAREYAKGEGAAWDEAKAAFAEAVSAIGGATQAASWDNRGYVS
jgi:hypothetical protein